MLNKEQLKISAALAVWLESQEIKTNDGVMVMSSMIACAMAMKAKSLVNLLEGTSLITTMIEIEAIIALESKLGKITTL